MPLTGSVSLLQCKFVVKAGVAQRQSSCFVNRGSRVRIPPPAPRIARGALASREARRKGGKAALPSGGYPSGQRGQTVNLVALPSGVRIPPCPPPRRDRATRGRVGDSRGRSSMVELELSKLDVGGSIPLARSLPRASSSPPRPIPLLDPRPFPLEIPQEGPQGVPRRTGRKHRAQKANPVRA